MNKFLRHWTIIFGVATLCLGLNIVSFAQIASDEEISKIVGGEPADPNAWPWQVYFSVC